jgi:HEAT repeat protein
MKRWKQFGLGLIAFAGLTPSVWAQPPTTPPPAPAAAPAQPTTLWSFLGLSCDQIAKCKAKICATPLGQLMNNATKPMTLFSGGLIGGCCPSGLSQADLAAAGAGGGAAGAIQADEAAAKAKRAVIRYLATVDCYRWPGVSQALADYLRKENNECVRWEAAMALGTGCCCNKITIEALAYAAAGIETLEKDENGKVVIDKKTGKPVVLAKAETCERVRAAAYFSLEHCLACIGQPAEPPVAGDGKKEGTGENSSEKPGSVSSHGAPGQLTSLEKRNVDKSLLEAAAAARRLVDASGFAPSEAAVIPTGQRSLFHIFQHALGAPATHGLPGDAVPAEAPEGSGPLQPQPAPATLQSQAAPAPLNVPATVNLLQSSATPSVQPPVAPPVQSVVASPVQSPVASPVEAPSGGGAPPTAPPAAAPAGPAPEHTLIHLIKHVMHRDQVPRMAPGSSATATTAETPANAATVPVGSTAPNSSVIPTQLPDDPKAPVQEPVPTQSPAPADADKPVNYTIYPATTPAPASGPGPQSRGPVPADTLPAGLSRQEGRPQASPALNIESTQQLLYVLLNAVYPWQREWAADALAASRCQATPDLVQALLTAAQKDSAPAVRARCVHCLAELKVQTTPVVNVLLSLRSDTDPRVRLEADQVLSNLGYGPPAMAARPAATTPGFAPTGN